MIGMIVSVTCCLIVDMNMRKDSSCEVVIYHTITHVDKILIYRDYHMAYFISDPALGPDISAREQLARLEC